MNTETKTKKINWPKAVLKLTAKDFSHGHWQEACGTKFCAVGWVVNQFGLPADPAGEAVVGSYKNKYGKLQPIRHCFPELAWDGDGLGGSTTVAKPGTPVHEFARTFAKNLGADLELFEAAYANRGLFALSDVFEEGLFVGSQDNWIDEKKAAKAWNKTIADLGYTEETVVDWP